MSWMTECINECIIFDASKKVIKEFDFKLKGSFMEVVKFTVGLCK